jgi:hypothetical protein
LFQENAMSMQKILVMVPPRRAVPRGAVWFGAAAGLFAGHARVRSGMAAWLEAARAKREVDRAARRHARQRSELIALARRYQATQPEFAKDLFAAASNDRD